MGHGLGGGGREQEEWREGKLWFICKMNKKNLKEKEISDNQQLKNFITWKLILQVVENIAFKQKEKDKY